MAYTCTVLFEDPFWVAVFERGDEAGYAVARVVFGAEPGEAELLDFALHRYNRRVVFSAPLEQASCVDRGEVNFKRRQREVRRLMAQQGGRGCTRAQAALQAERERGKQERQQTGKEEREESQAEKYRLRQQHKKEKHRGR